MIPYILVEELKKRFKSNEAKLIYITDKSFFYKTEDKKYVIKETTKCCSNLYKYLNSLNISSINYPIDEFKLNEEYYMVFNYIENIYHPDSKKILEYKDGLKELHFKTETKIKLSQKNFKYLKRVYQKLDYKFKMLELFIRNVETKEKKDDYDWIILSKYHIYLDAKKEMFKLQKKIHQAINNKLSVIYVVNHCDPKLSHFINHKIISIDKAKLGVVASDIAKFYLENESINIDWYLEINNWLISYNDPFYKTYFKFLVLYIYMLNLNISLLDSDFKINNYVRLSEKIKKFLNMFYSYH